MPLTARFPCDEADYDRIRDLLVRIFGITRTPFTWGIERWDYWRYYVRYFAPDHPWLAAIQLWETAAGELVAVANPEGRTDIHLQILPEYRVQLESAMLDWAEQYRLTVMPDDKPCKLEAWAYDDERRELLRARGYTLIEDGYKRQRPMNEPIAEPVLPESFTIRTVGGDEDIAGRVLTSAKAFGADQPAPVSQYKTLQTAPMYREDLDMLVIAPDGSVAALALAWFDEVNRIGYFEPVATHPDYQRRGLGKAVMNAALQKLKALGATDTYLGCGKDEAVTRLYESVGFHITYDEDIWTKTLRD